MKRRRKKRSKPQKPRKTLTSPAIVSPRIAKYYLQRHTLFSKYDAGVQLDEEGWFSVTPEPIAARHASLAADNSLVIDCFSGVGGNAIQFASRCHVIAIEIDAKRVELAVNNANIYGVEDYIDFVIGDFFQLAPRLKGDIAFLAPPWGGPSYSKVLNFTLDMLKPKHGYSIFQAAQSITPNIIMFLPRNMDLNEVEELSWLSSPPLNLKMEENQVKTRTKGITAYFGDTASALPEDS
ncbi:uncharacterized protein A4U43_C05F25670 [Asparagus officinalis]|uniref:Trimethylguanosine synthase n=1 Tax=Asparagus officinalis TaxID=4686 RepID=A0A5P1EUG6_ASPOF|nr:trimethylguanosine synthase-like isoform X2 [Asparagus officinalis]ONK69685.1 uncharacterized protein A4U43_C05F25670 [Asparagus officinalis]